MVSVVTEGAFTDVDLATTADCHGRIQIGLLVKTNLEKRMDRRMSRNLPERG